MSRPYPHYASGLRLAAVVVGLQRRPEGWAYEDIATRVEVDRRTVGRYVKILVDGNGIALGLPAVERCRVAHMPGIRLVTP